MNHARTVYKVDPDSIAVPSLLGFSPSSPLPIDLSLLESGGASAAVALLQKAGGGLQAEKDGVTLLGVEHGDRSIQPVPEEAVAPNVLGQWRFFVSKNNLGSEYKKFGDSETVIHVSKSGDTYIGRVIFAPPGFEAFKGLEIFRMKISEAARSAGQPSHFVGQALRVTTKSEQKMVGNEVFWNLMITGTQWVKAEMTCGESLFVSSFNSWDQSGTNYTYERTAKREYRIGVGLYF